MDFWVVHGWLFILALAFFPRLTILFGLIWGTMVSGGVLWWLGWVLVPRLLVACLATTYYWDTNPVLVVFSWIYALVEERAEWSSARSKSND